ncbi:MAG: hypothetical protein CMN32_08050 [Saprospirales bacterium]|nr:hypothetical protein [Saprospirales bacterium]
MPGSILIELQYLPPVASLLAMARSEVVYLEACEHYSKGSWRNRCLIAAANGTQLLSVPLRKGKHQQMPIREVRIAYDEPWQARHWQAIQSAYGRAPFFEHFGPELAPLYQKQFTTLWEWNLSLLTTLYSCFGLRPNWQLTESWEKEPATGIRDLRNAIHPKKPLPEDLAELPPYPQVFEDKHGFLPNLCALDLLMCQGRLL